MFCGSIKKCACRKRVIISSRVVYWFFFHTLPRGFGGLIFVQWYSFGNYYLQNIKIREWWLMAGLVCIVKSHRAIDVHFWLNEERKADVKWNNNFFFFNLKLMWSMRYIYAVYIYIVSGQTLLNISLIWTCGVMEVSATIARSIIVYTIYILFT